MSENRFEIALAAAFVDRATDFPRFWIALVSIFTV
jgi:hypothetical protein